MQCRADGYPAHETSDVHRAGVSPNDALCDDGLVACVTGWDEVAAAREIRNLNLGRLPQAPHAIDLQVAVALPTKAEDSGCALSMD